MCPPDFRFGIVIPVSFPTKAGGNAESRVSPFAFRRYSRSIKDGTKYRNVPTHIGSGFRLSPE